MRGQQQQWERREEGEGATAAAQNKQLTENCTISENLLAAVCCQPASLVTLKVLNHINTLGNVLRRAATLKICVKPSNEGSKLQQQQQQSVDRKSCSKAHDNAQKQKEKKQNKQREKKRKTQHSA